MTVRERARLRARAWYAANKDRAAASMAVYRARNAGRIKEQKREDYEKKKRDPKYLKGLRAYTAANKERKSEYDREYRLRNAEHLDEIKTKWRAANSEKMRIVKLSYKARRRQNEKGGSTTAEVAAWSESQDRVCHWCGVDCAPVFHIDHYVPLARGGKHEVSNLVIACPPCNLRKNATAPEEFARRMAA